MVELILNPSGWTCKLSECQPGFFVVPSHNRTLCFKDEYGNVYNETGEYFCAKEKDELIVQMVKPEWVDEQ